MNIKELMPGDFLSEKPFYKFVGTENNENLATADRLIFESISNGEKVVLSRKYVSEFLISDSMYTTSKELNKTELRALFEKLDSKVMTVAFQKADVKLTIKALEKSTKEQMENALARFQKAKKQKKSTEKEFLKIIKDIQDSPITKIVPGPIRVMRGYKTQFSSIDGMYKVMDLEAGIPKNVTITKIVSIVADNVKYYLKGFKNTL